MTRHTIFLSGSIARKNHFEKMAMIFMKESFVVVTVKVKTSKKILNIITKTFWVHGLLGGKKSKV